MLHVDDRHRLLTILLAGLLLAGPFTALAEEGSGVIGSGHRRSVGCGWTLGGEPPSLRWCQAALITSGCAAAGRAWVR